MLQTTDKRRLDKVLEVIERHEIRFPVTELAKKLNKSKGEVSEYLKGKKPMSDNFYKTFIEHYPDPIEIKNGDLIEQIARMEERLIRLEGYTSVLFDTAVASLSLSSGKLPALSRAELQEAVVMVQKHLLEGRKKK